MSLKQDLARYAFERGADSVGVADVAAYTAVTESGQVPDYLCE